MVREQETSLGEMADKLGVHQLKLNDLSEITESMKTEGWTEDHEVNNCMGCNDGFSISKRKVWICVCLLRFLLSSQVFFLPLGMTAPLPQLWKDLLCELLRQQNDAAFIKEACACVRHLLHPLAAETQRELN